MIDAGFGLVALTSLGMGDLVSMVVISMLTGLLTFSAVVSFLSKSFIPATILGVVALTTLELEIATLISSTSSFVA